MFFLKLNIIIVLHKPNLLHYKLTKLFVVLFFVIDFRASLRSKFYIVFFIIFISLSFSNFFSWLVQISLKNIQLLIIQLLVKILKF